MFAEIYCDLEDIMSFRTLFLSRLLGLFFLICGLEMLLHKLVYWVALSTVAYDPLVLRWIATVITLAGLAMVLAHNVWSKRPVVVIVTLLGWLTLIKGLAFMFLPARWMKGFLQAVLYPEAYLYLVTAFLLVLGAYLTYEGFKSRPA
jgi:uncharacterized protein YjeT (DUF2065 family)